MVYVRVGAQWGFHGGQGMKLKIKNRELSGRTLLPRFIKSELAMTLDRARAEKMQHWYCDGTASDPDPLEKSLKVPTNFMFFVPPDPGRSIADSEYKPSERREREMRRLAVRFLRKVGASDTNDLDLALQQTFGWREPKIPVQDMLAKYGPLVSVRMMSIARYRHIQIDGATDVGNMLVLSLPYRVDHFVRPVRVCRGGDESVLTPYGAYGPFKTERLKPLTEASLEAQKAVIKDLRSDIRWRKQMVEEDEKELDIDSAALEGD